MDNKPANSATKIQRTHSAEKPVGPVSLQVKGKTLELNSTKLERWFESLTKAKHLSDKTTHPSEQQRLSLLGYLGLKNESDVFRFLHSKTGKEFISHFMEELAEIASLEEQQLNIAAERKRKHFAMLAFLYLGMVHKKKARAAKLNEAIQQQIDKTLQAAKEHNNAPYAAERTRLANQLEAIDNSIMALDAVLQYKSDEKTLLAQERKQLQIQADIMAERHMIFAEQMNQLETFVLSLPEVREYQKQHLDENITRLQNQLSDLGSRLDAHIPHHLDKQARQLMHEHSALLLHLEALQDIASVQSGEKKYYNKEGMETTTPKDAAFILAPNQKIAKDGSGNYYLIDAHEDLHAMDEPQKSKAMHKFEKVQTEILTIPRLIKHHCKMEKELTHQRMQQVDLHDKHLDASMELTLNMKQHLQATRASIRAELDKPQPDLERTHALNQSMPQIANNSKDFALRALQPDPAITQIRQRIDTMSRNPTPAQIKDLSQNMSAIFRKNNQEMPGFIRKDMDKIQPGQPIPLRILMNLNAQLYKLEFASIKLKMEPKTAPTPTPTAPTPFGTWPPKPR